MGVHERDDRPGGGSNRGGTRRADRQERRLDNHDARERAPNLDRDLDAAADGQATSSSISAATVCARSSSTSGRIVA